MQEIHLIPQNDEGEHEATTLCQCCPDSHCPNDEVVIIAHYSYDMRDRIEELVEELCIELNYGDWGVVIK